MNKKNIEDLHNEGLAMLIIKINRKENPYKDDPRYREEEWGEITLSYENHQIKKQIFNVEWQIAPLRNWLLTNEEYIKNEQFFWLKTDISIAKRIDIARDKDYGYFDSDDEFERWHDRIYNYYSRHSFRMGLEGINIPDVIIGINGINGEISLYSQNNSWSYLIDIDVFFDNFKKFYL